MASTIAADRLEYVLTEMREAIDDLERGVARAGEAPDALNDALLAALRRAHGILEEAQDAAERAGLPRLAVFGR